MWRLAWSADRTCFSLETRFDVRRMYDSLKLHSLLWLYSQIVEQTDPINHSVTVCFCRTAKHVDADHNKRVRFEININNDIQQLNDDRKCFWNGPNGVGMCKSSFEGSTNEI